MFRKCAVLFLSALALTIGAAAQSSINIANIKIRVERPDRIRGPENREDNYFNEIQVGTNNFSGFTADGSTNPAVASTWIIENATQPYNMNNGNTTVGVLFPATGTYYSCGLWLNGTYSSSGTLYGFAHAETACNYPATTKSMALVTSTNHGLNWNVIQQIIANPGAHGGSETGEGDCTPVPFGSYLYLYCRRVQDIQTSVARAPITSGFDQTQWTKYNSGWNSQWNGSDSGLGLYGSGASIFSNYGNVMLLNAEKNGDWTGGPKIHGLRMSFSSNSDATTFQSVPEPVLYEDDYQFQSNPGWDLIAYPAALNGTNGSSQWTGFFMLTYAYVPPGGSLSQRSLVMRNVSVSVESTSQSPHVGVVVSRWNSSSVGQRISSTEIPPLNLYQAGYTYEQGTGYLLTLAPSQANREVVECVNTAGWPSAANPDHLLATTGPNSGCDANYSKLRTAGWAYQSSQQNTVPLYRCYQSNGTHFASNSSTCEGLGTQEFLLGYVLAN